MSDSSGGWASPSGGDGGSGDGGPRDDRPRYGDDRPRDGDDRPRYGERVPGWTAPATAGADAVAAPPPARPDVYVQPPRRGLIPLHPLSFGQLLGASFGVIRWNPKATLVPTLIVAALQTVLTLGGLGLFAVDAIDRVQRAATGTDRDQILVGVIGGGVLLALAAVAVTVFTTALLQGLLVTVIARAAAGERLTIRQALAAGVRRLLPLLGFSLLLGALQLLALGIAGLLVVLIAMTGEAGVWIAVGVGILLSLAFLAAYLFFAVKLTTVPSTIVLERLGVFASIRRSWILMRGAFWRTLGLLALVFAMIAIGSQLISLPFSVLGSALGGLLAPNAAADDVQSIVVTTLVSTIPAALVAIVVTAVGQVAQVGAVVLVYLDRRMRREGLDLELQRYVEQGGRDPFEPAG